MNIVSPTVRGVTVEFLSDAWLAGLDAALGESPAARALAPLVIEQVVGGVPGRGEVRYRVWFDAAGGHARAPEAGDRAGDVTFATDYGTAVAIARGTENAQSALAAGRLRLGGNVEELTSRADALASLDDATAGLRAATTYAPESP